MATLRPTSLRKELPEPGQHTWGIVLGTVVMITIIGGVVSPRTFAFSLPGVALSLIVAGLVRSHSIFTSGKPLQGLVLSIVAFLGFAGLSAFWSIAPAIALEKSAVALGLAACAILAARYIQAETRANSMRLAEGLALGVLVGALYLFVEVMSNQAVKIWVINLLGLGPDQVNPAKFMSWQGGKLVSISASALTRSMTPIVLLLGPAILAFLCFLRAPWNRIIGMATFALVALCVFGAGGETAKLALCIGTVTGALAFVSSKWTARILAVVWVIACTLIVPISFGAHNLSLHKSDWLATKLSGASPRIRIAILNAYASHVLEAPVIGHGANMAYVLGPMIDKATPIEQRIHPGGLMRQHPHNVYMQVWFELGAIGALLFTLIGLLMLRSIEALPRDAKQFGLATFAVGAVIIAPSYGMWQYWFMGVFAFVFVAFAIARNVLENEP